MGLVALGIFTKCFTVKNRTWSVWTGRDGKDHLMPRVSAKRQITLPVDPCREVGIGSGDEYLSFVADGRITIVRTSAGAAKGFLGHVASTPP